MKRKNFSAKIQSLYLFSKYKQNNTINMFEISEFRYEIIFKLFFFSKLLAMLSERGRLTNL
jgi:hypothetical protein